MRKNFQSFFIDNYVSISLFYMTFIMSFYKHIVEGFYQKGCCILSNAFLNILRWSHILHFIVLMFYHITYLQILKHFCILEINSTCLWGMILLECYDFSLLVKRNTFPCKQMLRKFISNRPPLSEMLKEFF